MESNVPRLWEPDNLEADPTFAGYVVYKRSRDLVSIISRKKKQNKENPWFIHLARYLSRSFSVTCDWLMESNSRCKRSFSRATFASTVVEMSCKV